MDVRKRIDASAVTRKTEKTHHRNLNTELIKLEQMKEADKVVLGTHQHDWIEEENGIDPVSLENIDIFVDGRGGSDYISTAQGDDIIYAYSGSIVNSHGGNDIIYAEGDCEVSASDGDDVIYLNNDSDYIEYWSKGFGAKGSKASGGYGDDVIVGGAGSTFATGDEGSDHLELGAGSDVYFGGAGVDTFVIDLNSNGIDLVVDFYDVGDEIVIMNGSELAKVGDWYLQQGDYQGPETPTSMAYMYGQEGAGESANFLNIVSNSTGQVAAQIVVGVAPVECSWLGGIASPSTGSVNQIFSASSSGLEVVGHTNAYEDCGPSLCNYSFV